jgi:apolipoprotein N-acyltransferase
MAKTGATLQTTLLRWLLAVLGGGLWASCHGRHPWLAVSCFALVPFLFLLEEPRAGRRFLLGWAHGTVGWMVGIPWLVPTLERFGNLPTWLSVILVLALAAYLGLYQGLVARWARPSWVRGGAAALVAIPALWVAQEHLAGWLFGGFPWNLAAYAWTGMPGALPAAAWIGAFGVSFLVVAGNTASALLLRQHQRRAGLAGWVLVAALLAALGSWKGSVAAAGSPSRPVRILQPNIEAAMTVDWGRVEEDYRRVFRMSAEACDQPGALVLWPESAAWPFLYAPTGSTGPRFSQDLHTLVETAGCPILFNSVHEIPGKGNFNSAFLLENGGVLHRYDKRHLVPWGEEVLLKDVFPFIGKLARYAGDFQRAEELRLLPWGSDRIGMGICYEMIFPFEVAQAVRQGATVLATLSNDAWYGDSAARFQHFRAARFRAAESRRPLLRAALNGISATVAPDGSLEQELGPDVAGILRTRVTGRQEWTFFTRFPWLVPGLCWALAAFAIVAGRRQRRP